MLISVQRKAVHVDKLKTALAILISTVLGWTVPAGVYALADPLPKELKDFTMGVPAESVIEKIKTSGSHTTEPVVAENRSRLVWVPSRSPYYKQVIFGFTEKDRLFQVTFDLTAPAGSSAADLKKAFFEMYDLNQENPMRLKIKDNNVIMYGPGKKALFLIEFTDRSTGRKSFELFDRNISASDRPMKEKTEEPTPAPASTESAPTNPPNSAEKNAPQPPSSATTDAAPAPAEKK
jgi:hypothetical protein